MARQSDDVVPTGRTVEWSVISRARIVVALAMSGLLGGCGAAGSASPEASVRPSPTQPAAGSASPEASVRPSPTQPAAVATTSLPADGELAVGRTDITLNGVRMSFDVPSAGWNAHRYPSGLTVDKDLVGPPDGLPDGASVFFWASSPSRIYSDPCNQTLGPDVGRSAVDLAAAVSKVPGTDAVGPSDVTFGGRPAKSVALMIREDVGCVPASFYLWAAGGSYRFATAPGDEIRVWVLDVDGWRGFIEAETRKDASAETRTDLQQLVDSIRFE